MESTYGGKRGRLSGPRERVHNALTMRHSPALQKTLRRQMRRVRIRARVRGIAERPRLSVFRSARHIVAQLIDDDLQRTLVQVHDRLVTPAAGADAEFVLKGVALAHEVGRLLAERARAVGIQRAVFDRGGYAYHGRVKAVAEGARAQGLAL